MKYIVVVGDGMSDRPLKELNGKTPLEIASKPNMDFIAKNGKSGMLRTLYEGLPTDSSVANLSILGYDPRKFDFYGRGPLEAASRGIKLNDNDIALRCNLITEKDGILLDYSAGRISTEEAKELISYLDKKLGSSDIKFYSGIDYKHILILKANNGYSQQIICNPPHDNMNKKISELLIKPKNREGKKTSDVLNELILKSRDLLNEHPINKQRIKEGKNPANMIWFWGQGKKPKISSFKEKFEVTGSLISAVDLVKGIAYYIGLDVIEVPGATGYIDTNYEGKADYALKSLEHKDFVYVHVESTDEASHEGIIERKIKAIEDLDKRLLGRILNKLKGDFKIAILPDHTTSVEFRNHLTDPVPFSIYTSNETGDSVKEYNEKAALKGSYGTIESEEFMRLLFR